MADIESNVVDNSNIQEIGNDAEKQLKTNSYTLNAIKRYRAKNADKVKEYNKIYNAWDTKRKSTVQSTVDRTLNTLNTNWLYQNGILLKQGTNLNTRLIGINLLPSFNFDTETKIYFQNQNIQVKIIDDNIVFQNIDTADSINKTKLDYETQLTQIDSEPPGNSKIISELENLKQKLTNKAKNVPNRITSFDIPLKNIRDMIMLSLPTYTYKFMYGLRWWFGHELVKHDPVNKAYHHFFKNYIRMEGGSKTKMNRSQQTSYKFETAKIKSNKIQSNPKRPTSNKQLTNPKRPTSNKQSTNPKRQKSNKQSYNPKRQKSRKPTKEPTHRPHKPTTHKKQLPKTRKHTQHKAKLQSIQESRIESSSLRFPVTIDNMPILNTYLEFFYSPDIILSLDPKIMQFHNIIVLTAYLNIFDNYETSICYDYEKYDEDFTITSRYEMTNKQNVNLLFYYILQDFKENQSKICYGLLEYLIHDDNILSIDFDMQLYYVYCSYISRPYSVNERIKGWIKDGTLNKADPIFQNTILYFDEIKRKIQIKLTEINIYVEAEEAGQLSQLINHKSTEKFINTYLNAYGFLNMTKEFTQSFKLTQQSMPNLRPTPIQIAKKYKSI